MSNVSNLLFGDLPLNVQSNWIFATEILFSLFGLKLNQIKINMINEFDIMWFISWSGNGFELRFPQILNLRKCGYKKTIGKAEKGNNNWIYKFGWQIFAYVQCTYIPKHMLNPSPCWRDKSERFINERKASVAIFHLSTARTSFFCSRKGKQWSHKNSMYTSIWLL